MKINYYGFLGFLGFMGFEDPWYFLFFLFFLFFFAKANEEGGSPAMPELVQRQAKEKAEHKAKILESFGMAQDGNVRISNDDVQKLLGVSDATAERYLDELEDEGKLKQVGKTGQSVFYSKS